jgi:endonuclease/exonuclease/phosphatase family metal-dependent hydrolase
MGRLRLATYNIHKGLSASGRRVTLPAIASLLQELDVDMVALQEVQGLHVRMAQRFANWPVQGHASVLASATGLLPVYGVARIHRHGHQGNALLTRWPVRQWRQADLSVSRLEQRNVLLAEVLLPDATPLQIAVVHLNLLHRDRMRQLGQLAELLHGAVSPTQPLIVAGDFNDWHGRGGRWFARELGLVEAHETIHGHSARSFPAPWPLLALDRIYVRGLQVQHAEVLRHGLRRRLSDHCLLLADLCWPDLV